METKKDLYLAIGFGKISANDLLKKVAPSENIDSENGECEIECLAISMNPPFNYTDDESYSDYISMSFSRSYQSSLRRRFDSTPKKIKNSTDGTSHIGGVFTHIEEKMGSRFSDVTKKPDSNFKYLT